MSKHAISSDFTTSFEWSFVAGIARMIGPLLTPSETRTLRMRGPIQNRHPSLSSGSYAFVAMAQSVQFVAPLPRTIALIRAFLPPRAIHKDGWRSHWTTVVVACILKCKYVPNSSQWSLLRDEPGPLTDANVIWRSRLLHRWMEELKPSEAPVTIGTIQRLQTILRASTVVFIRLH